MERRNIKGFVLILILTSIALISCDEQEETLPTKFKFSSFEFQSEIKAYDMNGKLVESNQIFDQDEFLFDKDRGFEPADVIEFLSSEEAFFLYSSDRFGDLTLDAKYVRNGDKIDFTIEPLNDTSDSLKITYQQDGSIIKALAYGNKLKLSEDITGEIIIHSTGYGSINIDQLTSVMSKSDTMYVQEFIVTYVED